MKRTFSKHINIRELLISSPFFISVIILTFNYFLPFYDGLVYSGFGQTIVDGIYTLRDWCLFINFVILAITRKFTTDSLWLITISLIAVLLTSIFCPENMIYFADVRTMFVMGVQIYVIIRSGFINIFALKTYLKWIARLLSLLSITIFFNQQLVLILQEQYMDFANAISVICGLLAYFGIFEKNKIDLCLMVVMYLLLLIAGGRGSFSTMLILLLVLFWIRRDSKKKIQTYFILTAILIVISAIATDFLINITSILSFESRNISRILKGGFMYTDDRVILWEYIWNKAIESPFWGYGICSDRLHLIRGGYFDNGYYAHNIFLEMFVDFGLFGIAFFGYLVNLIIKFYQKIKEKRRVGFVTVFVFTSFIQLMLSRSFLFETNFYLLFALIMTALKNNNIQSDKVLYR